jgi:hypothetical protein
MNELEQEQNSAPEWGNSGEACEEYSDHNNWCHIHNARWGFGEPKCDAVRFDYQTEERLRAQRYLDGHKEWWDIYWFSGRY